MKNHLKIVSDSRKRRPCFFIPFYIIHASYCIQFVSDLHLIYIKFISGYSIFRLFTNRIALLVPYLLKR